MIVYSRKIDENFDIIVIFGIGLIGKSICNYVDAQGGYKREILPFNWRYEKQAKADTFGIFQYIRNLICGGNSQLNLNRVAFIWSAGKAGFGASKEDMANELKSYDIVLELLKKVMDLYLASKFFFHHLSSIGGLFEGQYLVTSASNPNPKRIYGQIKYDQEVKLKAFSSSLVKTIYRPSSVYGFVNKQHRMGLIQALLLNGIRNEVTTIFGNLSTLRDYVLNDNIGFYIKEKLFFNHNSGCAIAFLGAAKPSSIYEIKHMVEESIGRGIYLEYKKIPLMENDKNITISDVALPNDWHPTDIKFGINLLKKTMLSGKGFV